MRSHIIIIGAGISGLTAAITIGEGVDKLIAAGETIARPEMTLLDAADWIGGRARTDELSTGVSVDGKPPRGDALRWAGLMVENCTYGQPYDQYAESTGSG